MYQTLNELCRLDSMTWKRGRKTMHRFFTLDSMKDHIRVQEDEALQLVNDLLDDPTVCPYVVFEAHLLTLSTSERLHTYHANNLLDHDQLAVRKENPDVLWH